MKIRNHQISRLLWFVVVSAFCIQAYAKTFINVQRAGAKGDGKTLDTTIIQKAFDDCERSGGGTVFIPAGTYLSKPLYIKSNTHLSIEKGGVLKATDNPEDFKDPARPGTGRAYVSFINGRNIKNVTISGPGIIDGSGEKWWGPAREAKRTNVLNPGYTLPRPKLIVINGCTNLQVTNITLQNSPCFHLVPNDCENVLIDSVTILAPSNSPNTDAIDPSVCRNVLISKCVLDVGDDNVAIKSSHSLDHSIAACRDITVMDCLMLHGHGMSIGSESGGGVSDVTVSRCVFRDTENGLRIKSPRGRGGLVSNISYSDITMSNVNPAITITCYYPKVPDTDAAQPVVDGTPAFKNITIRNLTATCPKNAGMIVGLPESPVTGIRLENVMIKAMTGLQMRNVRGANFERVALGVRKGNPVDTQNVEVEGLDKLSLISN
jgi:polygalacturonase